MRRSTAHPLRSLLAPLSPIYGWLVDRRNARFDQPGAAHAAAAPVLSVGNLTTGGTGKTPFVIALVTLLRDLGRKPAILTRGYAARRGQTPDEVAEFFESLPGVPVIVDADRIRGATAALQGAASVDCLVLDDGFQHRRLARDLDLVLIDALDPWGGGRMLPAGNLREPRRSLRRAQAVVISRCNQTTPDALLAIETEIREHAPAARLLHTATRAAEWRGLDGSRGQPPKGPVLTVSGLGNPETFDRLVTEAGAQVARQMTFGDHHPYQCGDVTAIVARADSAKLATVLTTRKDFVKLAPLWQAARAADPMIPELLCLEVRVEAVEPDELRAVVEDALRQGDARR